VPLISRAVLVARLRELEDHGVIERRPRGADGAGHEYWLTPAELEAHPAVGFDCAAHGAPKMNLY
jgi:DNA-binding HxlR family transcriptional regulator